MDTPATDDPPEPAREPSDPLEQLASRLESARFTTVFRGFEPREVMDLLNDTARAMRRLIGTAAGASYDVDRLVAARSSEDVETLLANAEREARRVVAEAQMKAGEVRREAEAIREAAREKMLDAIRQADKLRRRAIDDSPAAGPDD